MHKVRAYFQGQPIVHWLMSVMVTFTALAAFGLLVHEKDWIFPIGLSVIVPTMMALLRSIQRKG